MILAGKTILITGASSGIGRALSVELLKMNCRLVLLARRKELLDEIISKNRVPPERALAIKCDVSNKADVSDAFQLVNKKFGLPDAAILNAAVGNSLSAKDYNSDAAENVFEINFFGVVNWVEILLPEFLKINSGIIAAVSSLADNRGYSGAGFYTASKAALTNHLEGLSASLKNTNIKIVTIRPGFVKTPIIKDREFTPFALSPEKAAGAIIRGLENEKRYIDFPFIPAVLHKFVKLVPGRLAERFLF